MAKNYHLIVLDDDEYSIALWALDMAAGRYDAAAERSKKFSPEYHMNRDYAKQIRTIANRIKTDSKEVMK